MRYEDFLKTKQFVLEPHGFECGELNNMLFDWQKDIVRWALKRGKAAIFADCGLGKTPMQLEWANEVHKHTNKPILILAPLAVAQQTKREGEKFGIPVNVCRTQKDVIDGINIANYEMLEHFEPESFSGIVLDESSILKHHDSKTRQLITDAFVSTHYKLACTATPAPNDHMELGNHAQFLGVMSMTEMLATFFVHDGGETSKWRLKGHAEQKFWEWMAGWAVVMTNPEDLGYDGENFKLPDLRMHQRIVKSEAGEIDGQMLLIPAIAESLMDRRQARRTSINERCELAAEIANKETDQVLVWCDLNNESALLSSMIHDAVEVKGADSNDHKTRSMMNFANGELRVLVSKPSIAGFGMNWQNCNKMIFVGLSDSYEAFYQAVRRCWRFGQTKPVDVYIIISESEGAVKANIERKEKDAQKMINEMVKYAKAILEEELKGTVRQSIDYNPTKTMIIPEWLRSAA